MEQIFISDNANTIFFWSKMYWILIMFLNCFYI